MTPIKKCKGNQKSLYSLYRVSDFILLERKVEIKYEFILEEILECCG